MDRLVAIRSFIEIVDQGSLTGAAELLGLSRAMVSRHLEGLEAWLGVRLLHRTTRRISLTDAGAEALPRLRQMLDLAVDVQTLSVARRAEPSGRLRVTTSLSFAMACLTQAIVEFQLRYPLVVVELQTLDRAVDLVAERIDLAVRVTNHLDDGVVARQLAECRSVLCAAPAYIQRRGQPSTPQDLQHHDCITHAFGVKAQYRLNRDGRTTSVSVNGVLSGSETVVLRQAALAGAGIAMLPTYLVAEDLAQGRLQRLLDDHEPERLGIHAVYLSRQHQSLPLKLLIEFLAERFGGAVAPWDAHGCATWNPQR